jgi:hypothetical protein
MDRRLGHGAEDDGQMTSDRLEGMRVLCADLDDAIQTAKENHAPMRTLLLIELARDYLQRSIDGTEQGRNVVELGLKAKVEIE